MYRVSVLAYGADPTGATPSTQAIQRAVDDCFLAGGGTVEVPAGTYAIASVRLRSRITLYLCAGATLLGSRDPDDYRCFLQDAVEPIAAADRTDALWTPAVTRKSYEFIHRSASRWNNAMLRAIDAEDVSIIGEAGSVIDGQDCYDPIGEEHYRGPHGINMHRCRNITLRGYTIRNTGNWAHAIYTSQNILIEDVQALAGHDGAHFTTCDGILIRNCGFYTGDDCVAGFDNTQIEVHHCELNTACSALRMGGTHVHVHHCHMFGPARHLFRGSLSLQEKRDGKPVPFGSTHRYNMLSILTYYADFTFPVRHRPGDIVIEDCTVEMADRFVHYNYSGNEVWQKQRPLHDITFRRVQASGLLLPLTLYGDPAEPVHATFEDCTFAYRADAPTTPFIHLCHCAALTLQDITVQKPTDAPFIRRWSATGDIAMAHVRYAGDALPDVEEATVPFTCDPI